MNTELIVIGAGAAGMMAAGTAGENGVKTVLLERNEKPGRKLMITGKEHTYTLTPKSHWRFWQRKQEFSGQI